MVPPPPLPDKIRRVGIPLVGGLSLMGSMGCGRAPQGGDDKTFEGSWNLVQQNYGRGTQSFPYGYTYTYDGESCGYFLSIDLEVDSLTQGRVVNTYGYIGCYSDATESETQAVGFEIRSDGKLIVSLTQSGDSEPGGESGGEDFIECERDGAYLECIAPVDGVTMRFARPECASQDDCSGDESCIGRQCTILQSGAGGDGSIPPSVSETGAIPTATSSDEGFGTESETGY